MNNQSFRDLLNKDAQSSGAPASALGTKKTTLVPTTSRTAQTSLNSTEFARQVRERHAGLQPSKKFKSSVPMGSKIAAGYTDRAKIRAEAERRDEEEKIARVKALEKQVKLGSLSRQDFESLSEKIMGIDSSQKVPVKGLDKELLARARRGESELVDRAGEDQTPAILDVDAELDKLGEADVVAPERVNSEKVGIRAPIQVAGVKRSRDEIMAELKAKRQAIAEEKARDKPTFDHRWRKVGEQAKPRIEIDKKGREVLVTVDEDGIVKRMVRKKPATAQGEDTDVVDKTKPVLGADFVIRDRMPVTTKNTTDSEDDDDIFAGAGTDYNPLGEEVDDDATHDDTQTTIQRNYFGDRNDIPEEREAPRLEMIENIIKKAANVGLARAVETTDEEKLRDEKRAKLLARDRDLDDMDLGFGDSRFDDFEDGEESTKSRLSEWKESGPSGGDSKRGKDISARKRKPKKRKGDVNNMDDIMRVLEGRRAAKPK
ncbi:uncharacterized protein K489DRAFT_416121 [Dissoconium aciculare CBS 342.82]|uniref:RED-like N-terminal domain-containing protein n=1 Tax=Dissoconium aciculare CBS 342.82 TaxID=1314786 RepID=A0A6J3LZM7_9PEZI|nr:uncharacterized protein K489DRAFT_416121 [Dissoconium aciculare CBS 342.82]KAF1820709.1 hypothetical protein K489DRAFT_416121 [Dissoconium aciculare CBS 342.82]